MGMFRRKDEPESATPEFDETAGGKVERERPADPRRRRGTVIRALGRRVPNSGGFGAGIPKKKKTSPDE